MESLADMIREFGKFVNEHGIFQTVVLVIIVGYVIRDWVLGKQNTKIFDALVNNNKVTTDLLSAQITTSQVAATAAGQSAIELTKQTQKLDKICASQDQMIDLTKSSNQAIAKLTESQDAGNHAITKLADSFGSDPFKICQQKPCNADDDTIIAKFAKAWDMSHDKVRERLKMVKEIRDDAADKTMKMGAT